MIQITRTASVAFLLVAGAVSCDRRDLTGTEPIPMEFTADAVTGTRSIADQGTLPATYTLCMSAHLVDGKVDSNNRDYLTAHPFVHDGGTWKGSPEVYWPLSGHLDFLCLATEPGGPDLASLCSWAEGNASRGVTADIPDAQTLSTEVLFAAASSQQAGHSAQVLSMHHSQCLHRFSIVSNASGLVRIDRIVFEDTYTGGVLTVRNDGFLTAGWSFDGHGRAPGTLVPDSENLILGQQESVLDILLPQQQARRIVIHYRRRDSASDPWDGAPVTSTLVYEPSMETWYSGKRYEYSIQARLDEFVMSVSMAPWEAGVSEVSQLQ